MAFRLGPASWRSHIRPGAWPGIAVLLPPAAHGLAQVLDNAVERRAVDQLHRVEMRAVLLAGGVDGDDVGVVQSGRRLRFAAEACTALPVSPSPPDKTLSATWRLSDTCRAAYTTPMPPRPSSRTTSKSPSRAPVGFVIASSTASAPPGWYAAVLLGSFKDKAYPPPDFQEQFRYEQITRCGAASPAPRRWTRATFVHLAGWSEATIPNSDAVAGPEPSERTCSDARSPTN